MTTYMLVGGAWLGGWCWRSVARRLRDNGHDAYPVTLTVLIETFPTEARRHIEKQVEELGDGWRFPMPPTEDLASMASLEGVDDEHLKLLRSRAVAQPFGTYTQPLRLENPAREELPKLGILCSFSLDQVQERIASGNPLFRELAGPKWRFVELPTGHWPMFSRPDDLAELLLELPSNTPRR